MRGSLGRYSILHPMKDIGPVLLGLCGAAVIVGARWVLRRVLRREAHRRTKHVVFFGLLFLLPAIGAAFIRDDVVLRAGLGLISLLFLWAAVGTAQGWPGFRDPPSQDADGEGADV